MVMSVRNAMDQSKNTPTGDKGMKRRDTVLRMLSGVAMLLLLATVQSRGQGVGPVIEPVFDTIICPPIKVGEEEILPYDSIFTNLGDADLVISAISFVSGDVDEFSISPLTIFPLTVPAGETIGLTIHFQPDQNGDRMARLRVESNDASDPELELLVIGMGATPRIAGRDVDFGQVPAGETRDTVVRGIVRNVGPIPLLIEEIQLQSNAFYIPDPEPLPVSVPPGDSFDLRLRYDPLIVGQTHVDSLRIESDAHPSPLYVKLSVNVTNSVHEHRSASASLRILSNPAFGTVEGVLRLQRGGNVGVRVSDSRGVEVYREELGHRTAGEHPIVWKGQSPDGTGLPAGIYYLQIEVEAETHVHTIILLR